MKWICPIACICTVGTICVVCIWPASDDLEIREDYRFILGRTSCDAWITSVHLNEVVVSKAIDKTVTDRDMIRIQDTLAALKRNRQALRRMLDETYTRHDLRTRDEAPLPMLEDLIKMTESLHQHLKTKRQSDLQEYFKYRDAFSTKFNNFKKIGASNKQVEESG